MLKGREALQGYPQTQENRSREREAPARGPAELQTQGGISSGAQPGGKTTVEGFWPVAPGEAGASPQGNGGGRGSCQAWVPNTALPEAGGLASDGLTHTPLCRKQKLGVDSGLEGPPSEMGTLPAHSRNSKGIGQVRVIGPGQGQTTWSPRPE